MYAVLIGLTYVGFKAVPHGFVPGQDKQYLVGFAQLPDGASLERTEEVIRRMSEIGMKTPGVRDSVAFPGLSINGFTNAPNAGIVFFSLDEFEQRKHPGCRAAQSRAHQPAAGASGRVHRRVPAATGERAQHHRRFKRDKDRAALGDEALYKAVEASR